MLPLSLLELHPSLPSPKILQVSDYTKRELRIKCYQHITKRYLEPHTPGKLKRLFRPSKASPLIEVDRGCLSRRHTDLLEP